MDWNEEWHGVMMTIMLVEQGFSKITYNKYNKQQFLMKLTPSIFIKTFFVCEKGSTNIATCMFSVCSIENW